MRDAIALARLSLGPAKDSDGSHPLPAFAFGKRREMMRPGRSQAITRSILPRERLDGEWMNRSRPLMAQWSTQAERSLRSEKRRAPGHSLVPHSDDMLKQLPYEWPATGE